MTNLAPKLVSLDEVFSVPELNQRMWTRMTGSEIAAHNIAGEPLNILCLESSAGYLKGHVYVISDDGQIYDVFAPHTHKDATSGTLYEIKRDNYKDLIEMDYSMNMPAVGTTLGVGGAWDFTERSAGTGGSANGTIANFVDTSANTKYTILTTAGTNATGSPTAIDVCNAAGGGGRLYFGKPITLQIKYAVSNNTSISYRMGCGQALMENAIGNNSMFGFEGCTGTDTINRVFSADGTIWSAEPLGGMVPSGSIPFGLRIDWYPSSKIVATDGDGTTVIKVSNLPLVGNATNANATFRFGVGQLAASTVRWIKIYAMRLLGSSYDSQSGIKGWV
jgi:hypothetical protein